MPTTQTDELIDFQLQYPTFHLRNFDLLEKATGLYGEDYRPIVKAEWYALHGQIIKGKTICLGGIKTDGRMNFAYPLPSGHGKKHIENVLSRVSEELGETVSKPTSYHPEQLVGKTLRFEKGGAVTYEQIKGHFADDLVMFDDAIDLIRGEEILYKESRKYLCKALDPFGENLLTKRMVGMPREQALKYFPDCTIIVFFQPFFLSEEVFLCGLFRRFPTIYLEFQERDLAEEFSKKVEGDGMEDKAVSSFSAYLKMLKDTNSNLPSVRDDGVKDKFKELHVSLVEFGESFGNKSSNFTKIIAFSLQNWLLKMGTILAYSRGQDRVGILDLEMAFVDLLEFLHSTFTFIEKKVMGLLDYGETWQGAIGKDQELLQWLYDQGALSDESSKISIKEYINKISNVLDITEQGGRKRYQKHKRMRWISSKQTGSHDSVVYLNFKPLLREEGDQGGRVVLRYREILERYTSPPSPEVSPIPPTTPQVPPLPSTYSETNSPVSPLPPNCSFNKLDKGDGEIMALSRSKEEIPQVGGSPSHPYHPDEGQDISSMIDQAIRRVGEICSSDVLAWADKKHRYELPNMKKLEKKINGYAQSKDIKNLKTALKEYQKIAWEIREAYNDGR